MTLGTALNISLRRSLLCRAREVVDVDMRTVRHIVPARDVTAKGSDNTVVMRSRHRQKAETPGRKVRRADRRKDGNRVRTAVRLMPTKRWKPANELEERDGNSIDVLVHYVLKGIEDAEVVMSVKVDAHEPLGIIACAADRQSHMPHCVPQVHFNTRV